MPNVTTAPRQGRKPVASSNSSKRIGLFFGAGAEIGYGLPSGGKFAIEIFRRSSDTAKSRLRSLLQNIDRKTSYANDFLPSDFETKRISVFGKSDYKSLIKSSMEYRRNQIIEFLDSFDQHALLALSSAGLADGDFATQFESSTKKPFGSVIYNQDVTINPSLTGGSKLFASEYFSAFLEILRNNPNHLPLRKCLTAFLQILVGCLGQQLASDLNDQVFTKAPDDIPIFDDVSGFIQIEISQAGLSALEIVLEQTPQTLSQTSDVILMASELARAILENMFELCLDYQALIDSHFRYLYEPKAHWGNFTKIAVFLNTVQEYISEAAINNSRIVASGDGYYHDLLLFNTTMLTISAVGTVNYNCLLEDISAYALGNAKVEHLHGSIADYYDPYLNNILQLPSPDEYKTHRHVIVPFLFTQSGVKPLTSITMSRRYVQLFDDLNNSDAIICIGFGFQKDDGHVNGMFRQLIEDNKKSVFILHYNRGIFNESATRKIYRRKLRLESDPANMHILPVDPQRKINGTIWYKHIETLL